LTLWMQLLCGVPIVAHHEDNCTAGSVAFPKVVDHCDRLRSTPVAVPQLSLVRSRIDASIFAMCVAVLNMSPPFQQAPWGKLRVGWLLESKLVARYHRTVPRGLLSTLLVRIRSPQTRTCSTPFITRTLGTKKDGASVDPGDGNLAACHPYMPRALTRFDSICHSYLPPAVNIVSTTTCSRMRLDTGLPNGDSTSDTYSSRPGYILAGLPHH
jgi:hypothetical protein